MTTTLNFDFYSDDGNCIEQRHHNNQFINVYAAFGFSPGANHGLGKVDFYNNTARLSTDAVAATTGYYLIYGSDGAGDLIDELNIYNNRLYGFSRYEYSSVRHSRRGDCAI